MPEQTYPRWTAPADAVLVRDGGSVAFDLDALIYELDKATRERLYALADDLFDRLGMPGDEALMTAWLSL